jgi:hypothetical protein
MLARFLLAVALALACGSDCRAASGDIDLPGEFAVTPIAQHMLLNGLPLEVAAVSAALAPRQACDLVAGQWSHVRPATVIGCRRNGDWLLVTRRLASQVQTAQFRQALGGVTGFISLLNLSVPVSRSAVPRLPLPRGAHVVTVLQWAGPEGESRQFTVILPTPPVVALRQLAMGASRFGWHSTLPAAQPPGEGLSEFWRGSERIQAMVVRSAAGSGVMLLEQVAAGRRP